MPSKPSAPKMPNKYVKDAVKVYLGRLLRENMSQEEAGLALKERFGFTLTQPRVSALAKEIRDEYKAAMVGGRDELVAEYSAVLKDIDREAALAWERSKLASEKKVTEIPPEVPCGKCKGTGKEPKPLGPRTGFQPKCTWCKGKGKYKPPGKITETVEGRLPANEFLRTRLQIVQTLLELHGLIDRRPVDKSTNTVNVGDTAVKEFFEALIGGGVPPPTQDRLLAVESGRIPEPAPVMPHDTTPSPQKTP